MMNRITERTFIPLSLVITLLGGSFFVSTLYIKTTAQGEEIKQINKTIDKVRDNDDTFKLEVIDRLSRIEGFLKHKNKGE